MDLAPDCDGFFLDQPQTLSASLVFNAATAETHRSVRRRGCPEKAVLFLEVN